MTPLVNRDPSTAGSVAGLVVLALVLAGCGSSTSDIPATSTATLLPSATYTSTYTSTYTITPTVTRTSTPTPTQTPSVTPTPSTTPTLVPMTTIAKDLVRLSNTWKFTSQDALCNGERSCQAFTNENRDQPYVQLVIYNDGLVVLTLDDESSWLNTYLMPEGAKPPYEKKIDWYLRFLNTFFLNRVTSNQFSLPGIFDAAMDYGALDLPTDYGYVLSGKHIGSKITVKLIPPTK